MAKSDIPYVPSSEEKLRTMMELAQVEIGDRAVDLGCGDGRVLLAMAMRGALATGYEVEPGRVELSLANVRNMGFSDRVVIYKKSFWEVDLSEFDLVTVYGVTRIMERLEKKLLAELKPGAKVVSNSFIFPNWVPIQEKNDVYLYLR